MPTPQIQAELDRRAADAAALFAGQIVHLHEQLDAARTIIGWYTGDDPIAVTVRIAALIDRRRAVAAAAAGCPATPH